MRILQVNKFFYLKGGPERYMFSVAELLKSKGHEVAFFSMKHENNASCEWNRYFVENIDYIKEHGIKEKITIFKNTLYSREAEAKLLQLIEHFKPDIAHLHNFNHQLTPSILSALKKKNVPIVMTLHDYKLVCPSYSMLNKGEVCELCKDRRFYHCMTTKCHKNSFVKSLLAMMESYLHHQVLNSYRHIKYFICPSRFIMNKMQEMGLKGNFIHLPNFVNIAYLKPAETYKNNKFVYWGRLSPEKGISTLINAFRGLSAELEIIGAGPLRQEIEEELTKNNIKNVVLSGYLGGESLFNKIRDSFAAIVPSECYENNPFSILEAFALGKTVVGARIGGIPELINDGETGLLFQSGNAEDLREKITRLLNNPGAVANIGRNVRQFAEQELNSEKHYQGLINIYNQAIKNHEVLN